jgi:hypothetical protein
LKKARERGGREIKIAESTGHAQLQRKEQIIIRKKMKNLKKKRCFGSTRISAGTLTTCAYTLTQSGLETQSVLFFLLLASKRVTEGLIR